MWLIDLEENSFRPVVVDFDEKILLLGLMIPVALNPDKVRLAVAGSGAGAARRVKALQAAGAHLVWYRGTPEDPSASPDPPDDIDLEHLHALWIVGLPEDAAAELAARARALRVLVNVEDRPELCDFHSVAEVRRGNLLLTVSTGGTAPGLSGAIRRRLEACFGPDWAGRLEDVAALRAGWRKAGLGMAEIAQRIDALLAERCWLNCPKPV